MPRTLPWLASSVKASEETKNGTPFRSRNAPSRPMTTVTEQKTADNDSESDLVDENLISKTAPAPQTPRRRLVCTPSTSPPPEVPETEYMREGFNQDDIWMMVEDEFYATAHLFTRHIHHAAYASWKDKHLKHQTIASLDALERPVDERTTRSNATALKLDARTKEARLRELDEQETHDDLVRMDPLLAGLIVGSQQAAQDLSALADARPKTRAAAGFNQSPHKAKAQRIFSSVVDGAEHSGGTKVRERLQRVARPRSSGTDDSSDLDRGQGSRQHLPAATGVADRRPEATQASTFRRKITSSSVSKAYAGSESASLEATHSTAPDSDTLLGQITNCADSSVHCARQGISSPGFVARKKARREKQKQDPNKHENEAVEIPTWLV